VTEKGTAGVTPYTQSLGSRKRQPGCLFEKRKGLKEHRMRISDEQVKKVLESSRPTTAVEIQDMDLELEVSPRQTDGPMIKKITGDVINMPDREDRIAEVKAMIDAGTYNPTGDDIADAMIRRAIADQVR